MSISTKTTITVTCDGCATTIESPTSIPAGWMNMNTHFSNGNDLDRSQAFQLCPECYSDNKAMAAEISSKINNF